MATERENAVLAEALVALVRRWLGGSDGDDVFAAIDSRAFEIAKRRISLSKKGKSS